jgi:hypothetical protein
VLPKESRREAVVIWEQQQAEKEKQKADTAFAIIKDLPKWLDDKFKELEAVKEQIAQALNDVDPQKHKWAFYLFYWKFVPKLCRCFPFPFCCEKEGEYGAQGLRRRREVRNTSAIREARIRPRVSETERTTT